jgi:hypothetical protein
LRPIRAAHEAGEVPDEQGDVLRTLPQSGDANREDVEPVVEVGPELLLVDHPGEVHVGGGHQTGICVNRAGTAEAFEFPFLEHAQQLGLQLERRLADLVQEDPV